jgi:hypothetical protein
MLTLWVKCLHHGTRGVVKLIVVGLVHQGLNPQLGVGAQIYFKI